MVLIQNILQEPDYLHREHMYELWNVRSLPALLTLLRLRGRTSILSSSKRILDLIYECCNLLCMLSTGSMAILTDVKFFMQLCLHAVSCVPHRKLKVGAACFGMLAVGGVLPFVTVWWQKKKAGRPAFGPNPEIAS